MDDVKVLVTCSTCRGAREMMKLGGVMGKCNLCEGTGKIDQRDVPVMQPVVPAENVTEVVKRVGEAIPWTGKKDESKTSVVATEVQKPQPIHETLKVERKKAMYKRKTTA